MDVIFRVIVLAFGGIVCLLMVLGGLLVLAIPLSLIVAIFWAFFQAMFGG